MIEKKKTKTRREVEPVEHKEGGLGQTVPYSLLWRKTRTMTKKTKDDCKEKDKRQDEKRNLLNIRREV